MTDTTRQPLTDAQTNVYRAILSHWADHGTGPTVRDLMPAVPTTSPNGVARHLEALERKGWLAVAGEKQARSIVPCELADAIKALAAKFRDDRTTKGH